MVCLELALLHGWLAKPKMIVMFLSYYFMTMYKCVLMFLWQQG